MLRISMQELDTGQADQCIDELESYTYPDEISNNILKLAEAVTNLDPEETEHIAGIIIRQIEGLGN